MNETPFKFTSEEKEQTLQILERLRTAVGDTFKPGDEQHLREDTLSHPEGDASNGTALGMFSGNLG